MKIIKHGKAPNDRAQWNVSCRNCQAQFMAATIETRRIDFSPCITKLVFTCPKCKHDVYHSIVEEDSKWFEVEAQGDLAPKDYIDTQAR